MEILVGFTTVNIYPFKCTQMIPLMEFTLQGTRKHISHLGKFGTSSTRKCTDESRGYGTSRSRYLVLNSHLSQDLPWLMMSSQKSEVVTTDSPNQPYSLCDPPLFVPPKRSGMNSSSCSVFPANNRSSLLLKTHFLFTVDPQILELNYRHIGKKCHM